MSAGVPRTSALVVGAGHAGPPPSATTSPRARSTTWSSSAARRWGIRGERSGGDSLRLLTPNWQARVPGLAYDGDDPDGFLDMAGVVAFLERYARLVDPPLETSTTVESVRKKGAGYEVVTDRGVWHAATVVLASGGFNVAKVSTVRGQPSGLRRVGDPDRLPPSLGPSGWRRPRGGGFRDGGPDRGRGPSLGAPGDPRGGGARPHAADLSGEGHPVVDGPDRAPRRALRRGRRHRARPPGSGAPARRNPGAGDPRPQCAHRRGRSPGGPAGGVRGRRQGAVLGLASQQVQPRRSEARPVARHHRRVDRRARTGGGGGAVRAVRADPRGGIAFACARPCP